MVDFRENLRCIEALFPRFDASMRPLIAAWFGLFPLYSGRMDALFGAKDALCIFERIVIRINLLPSALHVTRRADDGPDPPEASHLASRAVGEMGGVSDAELFFVGAQVFHKRLSLHGRIGILIAPGTVHSIS